MPYKKQLREFRQWLLENGYTGEVEEHDRTDCYEPLDVWLDYFHPDAFEAWLDWIGQLAEAGLV